MELDDRLVLAGAEGIDLDLTLAGVASRGAAVLIDLLVQGASVMVLGLVAGNFGDAGLALFFAGSFLILFGYPIVAEAFANGRTLGKAAMRIAVVDQSGAPASFIAVVIRNVVRLVDIFPGVYVVGAVSVLATSRHQRLGDLAARTVVVRRGAVHAPVGGPMAYDAGFASPGTGPVPVGAAGFAPGGFGAGTPPLPGADSGWAVAANAAGWDLSQVTAEEVAALRSFLGRRQELAPPYRAQLAQTLSFQILPKVAGVPLEGGPEAFIERIVAAKTQ